MLTLGTVWAAEVQEQREWELPDPHGPGLRAGSSWLCSERGCCAQCLHVGAFIWERAQGTRECCLVLCLPGTGLMLVAELWHPPRCHAPERLLPSLQSKGTWARASHTPPLSQLWAQLCPTFTEVVRDQLWVCSGGSLAHGTPLHPAISRRCPCCAAASRRNTLTGHLSSRHWHRGAANRAYAVIYCCHGNDHTVTC